MEPEPAPEPAPAPEPTPILSLDELLNTHDMLVRKEQEDKARIEAISALSVNVLRDLLMPWVAANMPDLWTLLDIDIMVPTQCSDGVSRTLPEYILFCTGREFPDHVAVLQQKLSGMIVGFQNLGSKIRIVVSKAALP